MDTSPGLMDAMHDLKVERVRIQRNANGLRQIAARRDEGWGSTEDLLPGCEELLAGYSARVRQGGHERLDLVLREETGLRFMCAVHSTVAGPGAGGLRRHDLVDPEAEVVQDALNLSRAMSYKNLAAKNGRGGSKLCVHNPPLPTHDRESWLLTLAEEIDLSGTITGPDMGFTGGDILDLAERTDNVSGFRSGGTTASTAFGVRAALGATAAALARALNEVHVAIHGLGGLGLSVAEELSRTATKLTVTDQDHRRIDALLAGLTPGDRKKVNVVAPYQITQVEADILCPCAGGGIITAETLEELRCRAVCGGANNQLAGDSLDEELALAERLHEAGILFVPDWLASAGGTIHGVMEAAEGDAFEARKAHARIQRVCGWEVDAILEEAKRVGAPPLSLAVDRHLQLLPSTKGTRR